MALAVLRLTTSSKLRRLLDWNVRQIHCGAAILNRSCRLEVNFDRCRRHVRFYPRNRPFQGWNRRCSVIAELLSPESFFQAAFMPSAGTTLCA
jgi:hypothetical protein